MRGEPKSGPSLNNKINIFYGWSAPTPPTLCPCQSDRPYSGTSTRPWYGRQLTGQKGCTPKIYRVRHVLSFNFSMLSSGFSAFRSWKSPTASGSTEHKAAAFLICSSVQSSFFSPCRLDFFRAGGFFLVFWVTRVTRGTIPVRKMKRGSEREGMRFEQGLLIWFFRPIGILGGEFGRDEVFWKTVHV